jgi:hypothetical protein
MTTNEILSELIQMESAKDANAKLYRERATESRRRHQPKTAANYDKLSSIAARSAEALEAAIAIIKNEN